MKKSRRVTLLLSLLLATAVAVGVYAALSARQDNAPISAASVPPTATSVPTGAVLVAKQDIPVATILTSDMVQMAQVPLAAKTTGALTDDSQAVGKMTTVALGKGQQLLATLLTEAPADAGNGTFAGKVPVGMRAISVVYDEVIGSGALVQPGDHVDVLAFFELSVKDFSLKSSGDASSSGNASDSSNSYDYKQYVSTYIVQNVEVLAVSQAVASGQLGTESQNAAPTPTPNPSVTPDPNANLTPVARPDAKSVTLAVTPEQAERLLLASQTVKNESGSLRLAMRAPGDTTTTNVGPAQLGSIPLGGILGNVDQPMTPSDLMITRAEFNERILPSGGLLQFTVTVKNISDKTIKSAKDAAPGFTYPQGMAYDALGFFAEAGTYRIGLNVAGAYPNPYPYRWGLGGDLKPGESADITGSVQLTEPTPDTRYWFGVIQEPDSVTQDGVAVSDITVVQSQTATVSADSTILRALPNGSSDEVLQLQKGDQVQIVTAQGNWFQVRFGQKEGWITAAVLTVPPLGATPVAGG